MGPMGCNLRVSGVHVQINSLTFFIQLRKLHGQQITHQVFLKFFDMICLAISYQFGNEIFFFFKI